MEMNLLTNIGILFSSVVINNYSKLCNLKWLRSISSHANSPEVWSKDMSRSMFPLWDLESPCLSEHPMVVAGFWYLLAGNYISFMTASFLTGSSLCVLIGTPHLSKMARTLLLCNIILYMGNLWIKISTSLWKMWLCFLEHLVPWSNRMEGAEAENRVWMALGTIETALWEMTSVNQLNFIPDYRNI